MLKNFLKTAYRNIKKNLIHTFINILGLSIGMAACLLLWQYVTYERSYDNFHQNGDNIYRVKQVNTHSDGRKSESAYAVRSIGPALKELPEIVDFVRIFRRESIIAYYKDVYFYEKTVLYADQPFFNIFSFPLIKGNKDTILRKPNSLLISESAVKKYFKDENPIGKTIMLKDGYANNYSVEGIFKDVPKNSHIKDFDFIASIQVPLKYFPDGWQVGLFYTYVLLQPGGNAKSLEAKIPQVVEKHLGERMRASNSKVEFYLQPLRDIHLYSNILDEFGKNGDARTVYFMLIIAIFILAIAWVNFINLSIARAMDRAKEVGLRKVVGASRKELIQQFFFEFLLVNVFSALLAIVFFLVFIPYYNQLTGNTLSMAVFTEVSFWLFFFFIFVVGTFVSGLYPALALTSFEPVSLLREKFISPGGRNIARQLMLVFQIVVSVALIAATLIVYMQVRYMKNRDPGFDKDKVLVTRTPKVGVGLAYKLSFFENEILKYPEIKNMALCFHVPGHSHFDAGDAVLKEGAGKGNEQYTKVTWVRYNFLETFGIKLLAGRDFSKKMMSDIDAVIINEKLLHNLGFNNPEEAIDKHIYSLANSQNFKIIGVIKNYNHFFLKQEIKPRSLMYARKSQHFISLKLNTDDLGKVVSLVRGKWHEFFPGNPFSYFFLDEFYNSQYQADTIFGRTFGWFALLAILIACMGLFGLSIHVTLKRTKEIGIRKVLGAGVPNILFLLSKDFIRLALIALAIALTAIYFGSSKWLESYAYRIEIGWWFWVIPAIIIIPIILLTIGYNVVRTAFSNPTEFLRYE